ncbi:MAG: hypothetical protein U0984_18480 [Prosthecobacter sp.]|nr:hypothetical protein [Prosthecobacter sp.]
MQSVFDQAFECHTAPPAVMDQLWAAGWRHFGTTFFRYSLQVDESGMRQITPLRLDLARFTPSKSQRRVLRKNADLRCEFVPAELSEEARSMFERHKVRFLDNVPDDLETFFSPEPATVPCECVECRVWAGETLVALSFLDLGARATSAVYGVFDPGHSRRSLGIYTMLKEIEFSRQRGCLFYYPGYATREPSAYDYKKQFRGLEILHWSSGQWQSLDHELQCEQAESP